jgi:hypothetical protein
MVDNVWRSRVGLGFEYPPDRNAAVGKIWHPIVMTDRLLPTEK